MIAYLKRKIKKIQLKKTFKEYGFKINKFHIDNVGEVEYAQWLHHFEILAIHQSKKIEV
jgi:hypothetical protein